MGEVSNLQNKFQLFVFSASFFLTLFFSQEEVVYEDLCSFKKAGEDQVNKFFLYFQQFHNFKNKLQN